MLRGFGQGFALLFLNQAAASSVPPEKAEDASGLFNAARNLGGSVGLSMIATLQDRRGSFHAERLAGPCPPARQNCRAFCTTAVRRRC